MSKHMTVILLSVVVALLLGAAGCERDTAGLGPAPFDTNPVVFDDAFDGIDWEAFLGSKLDAFDYDETVGYQSEASLRFDIPDQSDPSGGYAGGVIVSNGPRDLSQYNAVTFWAKASQNATLNEIGVGNDNTGTSKYSASIGGLDVKTYWQRYLMPIPRTGKMQSERGLFLVSEAEDGTGYQLWIDQVEFTNVDNITNPRPIMRQGDVSTLAGTTVPVGQTSTTVDVSGVSVVISHASGYFTFVSSDSSVAVPGEGAIKVVGGGTADITATLGKKAVAGRFTVTAIEPPTDAAPPPTIPASDVISIFSNAYTNRPVDSFSPDFENSTVSDFKIAGDDVKVYNIPTELDAAVIEFASQTIDATGMTHLHIDIWAPQGTFFGLGLVSFGADGVFSGQPFPQGDDSQAIAAVVPPELVFNEWVSVDIPLSQYLSTGLGETAHLAQVVLRSDSKQLIVDNVFFYNDGTQASP